jgi:aldehyde dehydrogenase (NAD+)
MQMANPNLPFGGVGCSGSGRYHGKSGFINFSNPKSICETKASNPYPSNCRFPPYTEKSKSTLLKVMKIGSVTYTQIYRAIAIIVILIILALVVGLVVVPKASN